VNNWVGRGDVADGVGEEVAGEVVAVGGGRER